MHFILFLAALVAAVLAYAATRPGEFRVERSLSIPAPAGVIFAQVNNLRKWDGWSPWAKLDPAAKNSFEGPESGRGAAMTWAGNSKVGEGRMSITDSRPDESVTFRLEFYKPFQALNTAEFTFRPDPSGTRVTWVMSGKNNFMAKVIGLFMDCEKMVGGQFEKGLAQLSEAAQAAAR